MAGHRITRRNVLGATVAGAAGVAVSGGRLQESLAARRAPAQIQLGGKLTYWGGLIYSEEANDLLSEAINQWGSDNGVETEVVMINTNDMNTRVAAAVESNTMPDAFDNFLDLLLLLASQDGILAPVDDIYTSIGGAQGGWYEAMADASDTTAIAGFRTGIPFGGNGNFILRRNDILTAAGFPDAPTTWDELMDQAIAVNAPPLYGFALAFSNVGDGNVNVAIWQSFGGRMADDEGKMVTLDSPGTRAYLEWVKRGLDAGVYPPGNTTWDGSGDNTAYLAGQAAFVINVGTIAIAARTDDPELFEATAYSPYPSGPVLSVSPVSPASRSISARSENIDAAKALIEHLANPEFAKAYFDVAIYSPVLKDQTEFETFNGSNEMLAGLKDLVVAGTSPGYPDVYNTAYGETAANFLIPKMVQRVSVDGYDFDRAIAEAHAAAQAIYDKYN